MQSLYDLSPLTRIMFVGVLLALLPLSWVWWRSRRASSYDRVQALTLMTLFLTFDLVMFGAFTRLTDSGLGCPDWPGCYGSASPMGAEVPIAAAQSAMPSGPVTHGKAWVEMIHRYLATSVGALIVVLAAVAWLRWQRRTASEQDGEVGPWWPTLTLLWVCVQGAFGALTVTMKLFPAIVTLHLLGGVGLLALLCVQWVRLGRRDGSGRGVALPSIFRWLAWLSYAMLLLQIALGGWVSANYAVLACADFPQCQNSWWPRMDFQQGFELWRGLGLTRAGEIISFDALTAIHYMHRLAAFVVLSLLAALAWRLNGVPALRRASRWIAALTGLQLATGLSNVIFSWPLLAAVLHTGGAGALVLALTWVLATSGPDAARHRDRSAPQSGRPA
jgi:cytochrome c oxidase assembly protein subunit 15